MEKFKKIEIDAPKYLSAFVSWFYENQMLYGNPFEQWWEEKGSKDFQEWAMARNLEYMKIEKPKK